MLPCLNKTNSEAQLHLMRASVLQFPLRLHRLILYHLLNERDGTAVAQLIEALRYKSEGRGFDSRLT